MMRRKRQSPSWTKKERTADSEEASAECIDLRLFGKRQQPPDQNTDNNDSAEQIVSECATGGISPNQSVETRRIEEILLDSLSPAHTSAGEKCSFNRRHGLNDSATLSALRTKYVHGSIRIQDTNGIVYNNEGSSYVNFKLLDDDNNGGLGGQLADVPKFMSCVWNMKSPQIIIPIITGLSNFKNWKNRKLEEQFRRGIVKAANKTEMWFITNGINGGIAAMVGDAFNEEKASRLVDY